MQSYLCVGLSTNARGLQTKGLERVYIYAEWDWEDAMWHAHFTDLKEPSYVELNFRLIFCFCLKVSEFLHAAFNLIREHRSVFFASSRLVFRMNKLWTISSQKKKNIK